VTGIVTTIAGNGDPLYSADGVPATSTGLTISDLTIDPAGNIIFGDSDNHRIRMVDTAGEIHTIAGNGTPGFADGPALTGMVNDPTGMTLDAAGAVYFGDFDNSRIRKLAGGVLSTVAGNGTEGYNGDNILATDAALANPTDVSFDAAGNMYIADYANHRVRRVDAVTKLITTIAGVGTPGDGPDGGPAAAAGLRFPSDVEIAADGSIIIIDSGNERIRRIDAAGDIDTIAGTGMPGFSGDGGPAAAARLLQPLRMRTLPDGRIFFGDRHNFRVRALVPSP
jgi:hypothetical protein